MRLMEDKASIDVKIIGVLGMIGIGRTTLAKVIYSQLFANLGHCSFLAYPLKASSQHRGMEGLQKQCIFDTPVDDSMRDISNVDEGITIIKKSFKRNCKKE